MWSAPCCRAPSPAEGEEKGGGGVLWVNIRLTLCFCVCRFLTMDQSRKLLLLLESDPKACSLPLVGV